MPGLLQGLLWETSLLDAEEGIRFRGYSIPELQVLQVYRTQVQTSAVGSRARCMPQDSAFLAFHNQRVVVPRCLVPLPMLALARHRLSAAAAHAASARATQPCESG